jgi:hypothetical protein
MARGSAQKWEWLKQLTCVHFERTTLLCIIFLVGVAGISVRGVRESRF